MWALETKTTVCYTFFVCGKRRGPVEMMAIGKKNDFFGPKFVEKDTMNSGQNPGLVL